MLSSTTTPSTISGATPRVKDAPQPAFRRREDVARDRSSTAEFGREDTQLDRKVALKFLTEELETKSKLLWNHDGDFGQFVRANVQVQ